MFETHRQQQHSLYNSVRQVLVVKKDRIIELEKYIMEKMEDRLRSNIDSIKEQYNEASYLYPFWQNYPPEARGRAPVGDQVPWIEVGEHAIGTKLRHILTSDFEVQDFGLPTGADQRLLLKNEQIPAILMYPKSAAWLFTDIKSVGPRDSHEHAVMSGNQVSGDGKWESMDSGVTNSVLKAEGKNTSHNFQCAIPPFYIMSDQTIAPVINIVTMAVYKMDSSGGQPLAKIKLAAIPNGLFLGDYCKTHPGLLFPGKDDKSKSPEKLRARIDFGRLKDIADWRLVEICL